MAIVRRAISRRDSKRGDVHRGVLCTSVFLSLELLASLQLPLYHDVKVPPSSDPVSSFIRHLMSFIISWQSIDEEMEEEASRHGFSCIMLKPLRTATMATALLQVCMDKRLCICIQMECVDPMAK